MRLGKFVFRVLKERPPRPEMDAVVMYPLKDRRGERRGTWVLGVFTGAYVFYVSYHR